MKRAMEIKTAASSFPVTTQRTEWKPESRALFSRKKTHYPVGNHTSPRGLAEDPSEFGFHLVITILSGKTLRIGRENDLSSI